MAVDGRASFARRFLLLTLLRREAALALRSLRLSSAAWILLGGGFLLCYGVGIVVVDVRTSAGALRGAEALWWLGVPAACLAVCAGGGRALGRVVAARAHAPVLAALPLSTADRRRMTVAALVPVGIFLASVAAACCATLSLLVDRPSLPVASSALAAGVAGFCAGAASAVLRPPRPAAFILRERAALGLAIGPLDRPGLAWFGAWAWRLEGGRLRPTPGNVLAFAAAALAVALAAGASLARREAGPAVAAAVLLGVASFMVALRCRPLASPVLRSAPIGFVAAWLRLMRLPALLSAVAFACPAGAAIAAEPAAWTAPVSGALWVVGLDIVYAIFAVTFLASPALAAVGFVATLAYAAYESIEYGSAVAVAVAALLAALVMRARRRFRHG